MSEEHVAVPKPRFAAWLAEPMKRNSATYWKVALAAVFINIFNLLTSIFSMVVYDRVVPNNAISSLVGLSVGLALIIVFDFILKMLRAYFVDLAGADIDQNVGEHVFARLVAMRLELKQGSTGSLSSLMRELEGLREFFASATLVAIVDVPFIFLTLIVIALIGGPLVLVPAVLAVLVVIVGVVTQPAIERLSARTMGQGMAKQSVLVETIGSLEVVKASGAGPLLKRRWRDAVSQQSESSMRQRLIASIGMTFAGTAGTLSYAGVIVAGVFQIAAGDLTTGGLIACSILASRAIAPLGQITQLLTRLTGTRTAYRQLDALMQQPVEGPEKDGLKLARPEGKIEFRNVSFRYPGGAEKVLEAINFTIKPGEHVALLGRVGSGKSSCARLMLGLFPPEDGLVMIDGIDIRQFDPESLRGAMGAAMQDSALLTGTVRENISLGREGVDDEEVFRVAQVSGLHQYLGQIANGYDLRLADRGEGLSGGQRQSIAIARALAGSPRIVLLDEPSSAMDQQTEAMLIQQLQEELKGRTLVLITHRPQLVQLVERIILLDKGRVVADGPRDQIMAQLQRPRAVA
ncbi:type I secretion system permease/ATPase [Sphingomonas sp.]|jgi:ATP-binding cassette subfamily C protein LapB|uniref:type I secretion system permease/ATPase n=1 Tax=Sphingomonas sp. TaxID=28214 RepID=UPI002EDAC337